MPFLRISAGRLEDCEVPAKMCEITRSNYELKYDEMLKAIEDANFIGMYLVLFLKCVCPLIC